MSSPGFVFIVGYSEEGSGGCGMMCVDDETGYTDTWEAGIARVLHTVAGYFTTDGDGCEPDAVDSVDDLVEHIRKHERYMKRNYDDEEDVHPVERYDDPHGVHYQTPFLQDTGIVEAYIITDRLDVENQVFQLTVRSHFDKGLDACGQCYAVSCAATAKALPPPQ